MSFYNLLNNSGSEGWLNTKQNSVTINSNTGSGLIIPGKQDPITVTCTGAASTWTVDLTGKPALTAGTMILTGLTIPAAASNTAGYSQITFSNGSGITASDLIFVIGASNYIYGLVNAISSGGFILTLINTSAVQQPASGTLSIDYLIVG